ncbi:hypothetical protein AOLI_G00129230 [Acnodon oligacanthus]
MTLDGNNSNSTISPLGPQIDTDRHCYHSLNSSFLSDSHEAKPDEFYCPELMALKWKRDSCHHLRLA